MAKQASAKAVVSAYMAGVLDGSVPACRYIRLAVERHLRDLEHGHERGLHFDEDAGQHVIDFFGFLRHSKGEWKGEPFVLAPWQQFQLWVLFGWKRADGLRRFRMAYEEVPRKNGKALSIDTPIPTPDGWTRHGDLKRGDLVYNPAGQPITVLGTTEAYAGSCYRVRFSDGTEIQAHANHEWITERSWFTKRQRGSRHPLPPVTTLELKNTLLCGARNDRVHRLPAVDALSCADRILPVDPYVLGAWLGDGDSASNRLTCADGEIISEICRRGYAVRKNSTPYRFLLGKKQLRARLHDLNLLGNKHIPQQYLRASEQQRLDLLRGLMDTDGYVSKAGQCEIVLTRGVLFWNCVELLRSLGYKATVKIDRATLYGKDCGERFRVQFWGHADAPPVSLSRKAARLKPSSGRRTRAGSRYVTAVEPLGDAVVNCIEVDGGLYLAGEGMVPTHNSTLLAGIGLYGLVGDREPGAEVYVAATKREQANITHGEATRMVKASPDLQQIIRVFRNNLHIPNTASKFEPLGADDNTMDGLNIHFGLIDELHAHKTSAVVDILDTGTGARRQPLIYEITTAGSNQESICHKHHDYSIQILEGIIEDDTWWAFIACLDEGDDWRDPAAWAKANPNLGISVKLDDLERKAAKAQIMPSAENAFKRLHCNIWTQQETRWMPIERWDACLAQIIREALKGRRCCAGLDLSTTTDTSSLVLVFRDDQDCYDVLPFFWVPEATIAERSKRDRVPYDVWTNLGYITATPGNVIDYAYIREQLNQLQLEFDIADVGYDPYNATQLVLQLMDDGFTVTPLRQGHLTLSPPMKELERVILSKRLRHDGNPVLRWMMGNVSARVDPNENIAPDKVTSRDRIDGVVSLIMAIDRMSGQPVGPEAGIFSL